MMYEDYFKDIVGGNYDSPEYYTTNYSPYSTYVNDYEQYPNYENDMYAMDNEYDRFMPRQVSNIPYDMEYQDDRQYIQVSNMYPEIYKKITPVLEKVLAKNDISNIDSNILDKMTFEIYDEIENTKKTENKPVSSGISKIAMQATNKGNTTSKQTSTVSNNIGASAISNTSKANTKEVATQPNRSNNLLRDLIKILILNRITGNQRPPFPGGRPPIPPPRPTPRPPRPGFSRPPMQSPIPPQNQNPRPPYSGNRPPYSGNMPPRPGFSLSNQNRPVNAQVSAPYAKPPIDYFDVPYPEE